MAATNTSVFDLTTEAGVEGYLDNTPYACTRAEALSGGLGNYAFRLHLRRPYEGRETVILKHSRPYVKALAHIPLHIERQYFEVEALRRVREWSPPNAFVTVPTVYHHDGKEHVIIMEDCGSTSVSLKEYMQQGKCSVETAHRIGREVGDFLGKLHAWGRANADVCEFFEGNHPAKILSGWVYYGQLLPTFEEGLEKMRDPDVKLSDEETNALRQICEETCGAMKDAAGTVVMGDFWPGNLILSFDDAGDVTQIRVIDWEQCRPGLLGVELGQFCAELVLLMRFNTDICNDTARILLDDFLKTYTTHITPDLKICRRTIVQLGAHLVTWTPRLEWGGKETTQEVVKEGVKLVLEGYSAEKEWLGKSPIAPLVMHVT